LQNLILDSQTAFEKLGNVLRQVSEWLWVINRAMQLENWLEKRRKIKEMDDSVEGEGPEHCWMRAYSSK
jgi:hypothetical protein